MDFISRIRHRLMLRSEPKFVDHLRELKPAMKWVKVNSGMGLPMLKKMYFNCLRAESLHKSRIVVLR